MNRDLWLPASGVAFMVIALMVLIGVCAKAPSADQAPLTPTLAPVATMTPRATITTLLAPTIAVSSTPSEQIGISTPEIQLPTSTLTPMPTATATQEPTRTPDILPLDLPTRRPLPAFRPDAPVQAPAQAPKERTP